MSNLTLLIIHQVFITDFPFEISALSKQPFYQGNKNQKNEKDNHAFNGSNIECNPFFPNR